ncbi:MAG: hypothetical protein HND44_17275 [Chloroflexi bacterium]|nr:hypothetical protein [Ardenticatenaceae bacterium]MBL1130206.1 hypothetical protein [Chloroflexota bacterium]NOG36297.1 hypothetical protein [Chloroflexota bacterium]GIK58374.1 MAG: hypothetical protein BroJett015_40370 [Chloroflexota bacterium]
MIQTKFSLEESQQTFLEQYRTYGFKDKGDMVRTALDRLQAELEARLLRESADLYAAVYDEDADLRELTETAILEWPE